MCKRVCVYARVRVRLPIATDALSKPESRYDYGDLDPPAPGHANTRVAGQARRDESESESGSQSDAAQAGLGLL